MRPAWLNRGGRAWRATVACLALVASCIGCDRKAGLTGKRNDLKAMQTSRIHIQDHAFEVWLAATPAQRQLGLMQVTQDELAPIPDDSGQGLPDTYRGMLFIFKTEQPLAFWMYNTITPLDIAYIRADGEIVSTHTMAPLETRTYPSAEPAQFALEVRAGLFAELGIGPGDHVEIPEFVLKAPR